MTQHLQPPLHPRAPRWAVDVLLIAFITAPVLVPFLKLGWRPDSLGSWLTAILPAVLLPLRRRRPHLILVALLGIFLIAAVNGYLLFGPGIAVAATVFHIANVTSRRNSFITGAIVAVLLLLISVSTALANGTDPLQLQSVITVAFASAAGDATRSRRDYLLAVTQRAERAEQTRESEARRRVTEERLRIARDLHDAVAHQISVISLNAGVASSSLEENPERTKEALRTIRQASRRVLGEIGDLLGVLRASDPEPSVAPLHRLDQLDALLAQFATTGLEINTRIIGTFPASSAVNLVGYRIVQEALTNAHKHAADHRAHLFIETTPEELKIVVTNPFDPSHPGANSEGAGLGMIGMQERVASVRGSLSAGPAAGSWKVSVSIPIPEEDRQ